MFRFRSGGPLFYVPAAHKEAKSGLVHVLDSFLVTRGCEPCEHCAKCAPISVSGSQSPRFPEVFWNFLDFFLHICRLGPKLLAQSIRSKFGADK